MILQPKGIDHEATPGFEAGPFGIGFEMRFRPGTPTVAVPCCRSESIEPTDRGAGPVSPAFLTITKVG